VYHTSTGVQPCYSAVYITESSDTGGLCMAAGSMFDKFLLASVVLQAAWATTCTAGSAPTNCKADKCVAVGENSREKAANTECAQGLKDAGCKTCAGEGAGQTCTDCTTPGQKVQLDGKSCKADCPSNSAASANVCTCNPGYNLNGEKTACEPSSANKSGLSTGAIAGISVAAVVVVGGLVGFLCWWFICRGKA
ncbi:Hypothetical protein GSB_154436, partial [Giardia duodenalis]